MLDGGPLQPIVKWELWAPDSWVGVPVERLVLGTVILNLIHFSHSLNICDLLQLLENEALSRLPWEVQKMKMKASH